MAPSDGPSRDGDPTNVPTVRCSQCEASWTLEHELEDLGLGNDAVEAFAIDHREHTGHFPDDVTPWVADCRRCPDGVERLDEAAARRWARTHARHTDHVVALEHDSRDEPERVGK